MPPRERWNDQAIDGLKDEVDDVKNELLPLKALPTGIAEVAVKVDVLTQTAREMRADAVRAEDQEVRRVTAIHQVIADFRKEICDRFDKHEEEHKELLRQLDRGRPTTRRDSSSDWKTTLAAISAVTVPLAAAWIQTHGGL